MFKFNKLSELIFNTYLNAFKYSYQRLLIFFNINHLFVLS